MKAALRVLATRENQVEIIDYSGVGRWSVSEVQARYAAYARRLKIAAPLDLQPEQSEDRGRRWIYPIIEKVIAGIESGDAACIEIGVEFLEEDAGFAFGRILKAKNARALRRAELPPDAIERIRRRVVKMLVNENLVREYREYSRLLRKVGIGDWWNFIEENINRDNPYVMRYYDYYRQYALPHEQRKRG